MVLLYQDEMHASVTIFGTEEAQTGEIVHRVASSCREGDFLTVL